MAIENAIDCYYTGNTYSINFNNNSVNTGEFWYCADNTDPLNVNSFVCAEITDNTDEVSSPISALTEYSTCYDCWANNYGVYFFSDCSGNLGIPLVIDVSAVTPSFFSTFSGGSCYIECEVSNIPVVGCFVSEKDGPRLLSKQEYNDIQAQLNFVGAEIVNNVLGITAYTGCEECLLNSPIIYEVENCATKDIHYVQVPNTINEGIISYTDGTEEFCGRILGTTTFPILSYTFVSFYGKVECEVCLSERNKKYIIANCVDSGIQEVVWGSQLFQNGSVSNLQKGGGCYEVLGETTDPVTISLFLDFEPQPTCTSCLECNGVYYEYAYCNEPTVKVGEILSYQIIPVGGVFLHPNEGQYVVRLNAIPEPTTPYNTFYSLVIGANCFAAFPILDVWEARVCDSEIIIYVTIESGIANPNDITQVYWGENQLFCVELLNLVGGGNIFFNSTGTIFTDCDNCKNNTTIGLRTINCYTQEVEVVDLSYSAWTQVTYFGGLNQNDGFNYNCFLDTDGICRTVPEFCPTTPTGNLKTLNEQYFNCPICVAINPEPQPTPSQISAGTEYTACQVCCPCSSNQSVKTVSVPHPTWTNAQGKSVVLLDAVQLGGMNGLNS